MSNDDPDVLRNQSYRVPDKLVARQRLWTYMDEPSWAGRIEWATPVADDATVVDIGCGNGRDLLRLGADGHRGARVGVDFSPGMLAAIDGTGIDRVCADAGSLPLAGAIADVVSAMHMLYHVPDITAALVEARRVMRSDGVFVASTNSDASARELVDPWSRALVAVGGPAIEGTPGGAFTAENGAEILGSVFSSVELKPTEAETKVPDAGVVRDYVASTDDFYLPLLGSVEAWTSVLDAVTAHAEDEIARSGYFSVKQRGAIFVCRP